MNGLSPDTGLAGDMRGLQSFLQHVHTERNN